MTAIQELTSLLNWSEPKTVKTRQGERQLQTAEPTPLFWSLWRSSKEELKAAGISVGKSGPSNDWEVCWWQAPVRTPRETIERMNGGPVKSISESAVPVPAKAENATQSGRPLRESQLSSEVQGGMKAHEADSPAAADSVSLATESIFGKRGAGVEMTPQPLVGIPSGVILSNEQIAIHNYIENGTGNCVVQARAGTGKTATITWGITKAKEQEILYLVFGKKNEVEAKQKILDPRVTIRTLNAFGFRCCKSVWRDCKPDDEVEKDRIAAACPNIPDEASGAVERLVGFAKNLFVGVPSLENLIVTANERGVFCGLQTQEGEDEFPVVRLAAIAQVAMEAAKVKDPANRISFGDQVWLAVTMGWVRPVADLIFVDETQDMNLPQLLMVQRAIRKGGRVCVVGDDRQCIYTFRGAHPDGMGMMRDSLKARTLGLTVTRRCPKCVVRRVKSIVPDYQSAEDAPEGEEFFVNEAELLDRLQIGDAVISRANAPLMGLCLALLRKGVSARIEGRDIGKRLVSIVRRFKAKSVPDFLRRLEAWVEKQRKRLDIGKEGKVRMAGVMDEAETLRAVAEGCANVFEVEQRIISLFQNSDDEGVKPAVVLSSTHKAKGLEWQRTAVLSWTFNKRWKNQSSAQVREEQNLWYVALTRTKHTLMLVSEGGRGKPVEQGDGTKVGAM